MCAVHNTNSIFPDMLLEPQWVVLLHPANLSSAGCQDKRSVVSSTQARYHVSERNSWSIRLPLVLCRIESVRYENVQFSQTLCKGISLGRCFGKILWEAQIRVWFLYQLVVADMENKLAIPSNWLQNCVGAWLWYATAHFPSQAPTFQVATWDCRYWTLCAVYQWWNQETLEIHFGREECL